MTKSFNPKTITDKQLIDALKKLATKLNRTPSSSDMKKYGCFLTKRVHLYRKRFGKLKNAQTKAELDANKSGSDMKYSKQELLDELLRVYKDIGHVPSQTEISKHGKYPIGAYKRAFGKFSIAVGSCNLDNTYNLNMLYIKEEIIKDIIRVSKILGKIPTISDFAEYSTTCSWVTACHKISNSDSWNKTLEICGLEPQTLKNIPKEDLKNEIIRLRDELGHVPNYKDMADYGKFSAETYAGRFGTYLKALKFLGFNYTAQNQWRNSVSVVGNDGNIYRSKFEANVANCLLEFKNKYIIDDYKYEVPICENRNWSCDFLVRTGKHKIWIEAGGMGKNRTNSYSDDNEKIEYYKNNNFNIKIVKFDRNIKKSVHDIIIYKPKHFHDVVVWNGQKLTSEFIRKTNNTTRNKIKHYLLELFSNYDFSNIVLETEIIKKDLKALLNASCLDLANKQLSNNNNAGAKLCKSYFANILKLSTKKKPSVYNCITNKNSLEQIITNRISGIKNKNGVEYFNIHPAMIAQGAKSSGLAATGSVFKASVAKEIYSHWVKDGDIVYDYSAGYGGRLLGFYASGVKAKYIGTDPNTETYKCLIKMCDDFNINADIYNVPSENFIPDCDINFAFSSPPYYDHEIYTDEDTQSYNKFPDYEDWLNNYWRITVKYIKRSLAKNGVFAVNAGNFANKKMTKIHNDINNIVKEEGFRLVDSWNLVTRKSHFTKNKTPKLEPINFYKII
jgi:hypothetical protein